MSDTCGHVTWDWRISESLLDLNQVVQELQKAKNVPLDTFDPYEPKASPITTKINEDLEYYATPGIHCFFQEAKYAKNGQN